MLNKVTAISVCCNTRGLFRRAYESVREFYPDMKMIICDNSNPKNACAEYTKSLQSEKTIVFYPGRNIGHGPGMHCAIKRVETKYALIFDSDIVMKKKCISKMIKRLGARYGIGKIVAVNGSGKNVARTSANQKNVRARKHRRLYASPRNKGAIPYLHPFFQLVNVSVYKKFRPYINHGAPCIDTMTDIFRKGLSKKILAEFPVYEYVVHEGRGTRRAGLRAPLIKYGARQRAPKIRKPKRDVMPKIPEPESIDIAPKLPKSESINTTPKILKPEVVDMPRARITPGSKAKRKRKYRKWKV